MFKLKQVNRNPNNKAEYGLGKKLIPRLQWYLLAAFLLLPIIYLVGKIAYDNFYPHAKGIVVAEEFNINAPIDGYVESINHLQGDKVKISMNLVKLKSPILESQIITLSRQMKVLLQQKNAYQNPELIELEELKKQALGQIKTSKSYYDNLLVYQKQGIVTLLQLHDARQLYLNAEQQYKMILARITQTKLDFEVNKAQVFDDDIRKLELEMIDKNKQNELLNLVAPVNGTIKEIAVHNGEFVAKDKNLLVISSQDQFRILAFVDAKYLARVHAGAKVRLILPNKSITSGVIENIPSFTDKLYKGVDLVGSQNERKPVIVIKPESGFPDSYKVNGIEVEVLL